MYYVFELTSCSTEDITTCSEDYVLDLASCCILKKEDAYKSKETETIPARDCKELYEQGHKLSGKYTIKPDDLPAFEVSIYNYIICSQ